MLNSLVVSLGYLLVRLLALTYRFRCAGGSAISAPPGCDGYILAIWHQNLFAGILAQTGRKHVVIISRSRDGEPVSELCTRLGHHVSRGSSKKGDIDKGGKQAKDEMIEMLRAGLPGALTVDGPRGPARVVKPGIVEMARATGLPIVPYVPLPARCWSFKSWDQFRLPKPFSRIDVHYGTPLHVPQDTAFDGFASYQQQIADALDEIERTHWAAEGRAVTVAKSPA